MLKEDTVFSSCSQEIGTLPNWASLPDQSVLARIVDTRVVVNCLVTCLVDGPPGGAVVLGVR